MKLVFVEQSTGVPLDAAVTNFVASEGPRDSLSIDSVVGIVHAAG